MSEGSLAKTLVCPVCPHACRLRVGQWGRCAARLAADGSVCCANYASISSQILDPIEKKPLARFNPGSLILSVGSFGCNLGCPFCQNWQIAQIKTPPDPLPTHPLHPRHATAERLLEAADGDHFGLCEQISAAYPAGWHPVTPQELVSGALAARPRGNIGIAFTYNEPLVGYEYVRDTATLAQREGLKTVLVSNGYANPAIIAEVGACIDAANIDLKGFSQDFYDFVGAPQGLRVVKRTIEYLASHCHLEVTNLLVPGINSSCEEVAELARWLASIDPGIPLHITRYHPAHQLCHLPATPTPSGAGGRGSSAEASAPCLCG